jgi:hypothetical protein
MRILQISLFLAFVGAAAPLPAQTNACPPADNLVTNAMYSTFGMTRASSLSTDFERLFRSDEFEQKIKSSSGSLSISVPFEGVPVQFGAGAQFDSNWEKWRSTRDDSRWRLDQATFESMFQQVVPPEAYAAYVSVVESCNNTVRLVGRNVRLELTSSRDDVMGTVYEIPETAGTSPVIISVTCSASIQCAAAQSALVGKIAHSGGLSFSASWVGEATAGFIAVNTSRGSTGSISVRREPEAVRTLTLTYSTASTVTEDIGPYSATVTVSNAGGNPLCRATSDRAWWCSDGDNKWTANIETHLADAGPGRMLTGIDARCISGPCPWTPGRPLRISYWDVLPGRNTYSHPQQQGGHNSSRPARYALVTLKQWAGPTQWQVTGTVRGSREVLEAHRQDYNVPSSGDLRVAVPAGARNVLIQAASEGRVVSFAPTRVPTTMNLRLVRTEADGAGGQSYVYARGR